MEFDLKPIFWFFGVVGFLLGVAVAVVACLVL
jgi:hypothetical protein